MTPLRQRFIDDLRLRNKSPRTNETYVLRVALFARHFGRSPEVLGPPELRAYQQDLLDRHVSWSQFNQAVCALRFLYHVTLGRPEVITHLPFAKRPRTLPTALSPEEVTRWLAAALPGRGRTPLDVAYSCGLRLKELLGLRARLSRRAPLGGRTARIGFRDDGHRSRAHLGKVPSERPRVDRELQGCPATGPGKHGHRRGVPARIQQAIVRTIYRAKKGRNSVKGTNVAFS